MPEYALACFASIGFKTLESLALGQSGQIEMTIDTVANIKLPLPLKDIQKKIVSEIAVLEGQEKKAKESVKEAQNEIISEINRAYTSFSFFFFSSLFVCF